jgi:uncharacterized RDD family membrane protein YckC
MGVFYEGTLLFGVLWFFSYAFSALAQFRGSEGTALLVFRTYLFLVLGVYFTWFWSAGRRSLAMKTLSMRLVTADGANLSIARAAARYAVAVLMLALPLLAADVVHKSLVAAVLVPFAWMLADSQRRTLWDVMVRTRMTVEP